jgi:SAM-dependent methyltransferase
MLTQHLSQDHDRASRRASVIESQVRFIAARLPRAAPARILDLGCGPGLYLHRLAQVGHHGHGIDFSPAAIAYGREVAARERLNCHFERADLRQAEFGEGYDLVLLIYGQLNVFRREDARDILRRAHAALAPGGILVLEPQTKEAVQAARHHTPDWTAQPRGLFAETPHVLLHERFWDEPSRTATDRWYVIHTDTAAVERYAMSVSSYDTGELGHLLSSLGFDEVQTHTTLADDPDVQTPGLCAVTATRPSTDDRSLARTTVNV